MKIILALCCGLLMIGAAICQEVPAKPAALNAEAIKAYQAHDYVRFLKYEKEALALEPGNQRYIYNVACGEALAGDAPEAVRLLDQLLAQKLDLGAETDPDFTKIRKTPEWTEFESRLSQLRKPLVHSTVAFTTPDPGLVATGIAVDAGTGDTFIASVRQRKIVRRTKKGAISDFIRQGQDGFLGGDSLAVDAPRWLLYATTSAAPYMLGYQKGDSGRTGIFAFDLRSGRLVKKAMLTTTDGKNHLLNAMAIDRDGNVYVSDTGAAGIYLLRRGSDQLEEFMPSSAFEATQGLALSEDESTLYVADYVSGLWAVDLKAKQRRKLEAPADTWLMGLDGISRVGEGFIAVQIAPKPERVLRITLDAKKTHVSQVEILEMSHPDYEGPIQGTVAGNALLYIANSQLDLGDEKTGIFAAEHARPTVVLRLPL